LFKVPQSNRYENLWFRVMRTYAIRDRCQDNRDAEKTRWNRIQDQTLHSRSCAYTKSPYKITVTVSNSIYSIWV